MTEDPFHIAFCSDEAFVQHAAVAIRSLIDNASDPSRLRLWLLDVGMSQNSRALIAGMCGGLGVTIDFLQAQFADDETLLVDRHVSRATYGRLFLPELLDVSIESCLYLDVDLIVLDDILKLAAFDLQNSVLASVDDFYLTRNAALSMPLSVRYFNAGVLLLNLAHWRKEYIAEQILNYARSHPENLLYWDQDAMNAVLYNKRNPLPLRWNHQIHFDDCLSCLPQGGAEMEMSEAMSNPAIVHFVGPEKPWHYLCLHPIKHLYYTYCARTSWVGFSLPGPEQLRGFFRGKRIAVFGAGRAGVVTISLYRKYGCNPEYVLDNDPSKTGKTHEGLPIHPATYLAGEDPDGMVIVIASLYRSEIAAQLKAMGLKEYQHFVARGFEHRLQPK